MIGDPNLPREQSAYPRLITRLYDLFRLIGRNLSKIEGEALTLTATVTSLSAALIAPKWDDLRFPASGINPSGSANPPDVDGDQSGTFLFAGASDETIGMVAQMPHSWLEGSAIYPHIHWTPTTAGAGNVYWRLEYKICPIGSPIPGAWTTVNELTATPEVAEQHTITAFDPIDMTGELISCILLLRITRPGSSEATDTYDGTDVRLLEFDIHYQNDGRGSDAAFDK